MPQPSNSTNLIAAESALEEITESLEGMRETLTNARTFRRQIRSLVGTTRTQSAVEAVRTMKADLAQARADLAAANRTISARASTPRNVAEKLAKAKEFRVDLRRMLGVPKNGSVTVKVRGLLAQKAKADEFRRDLRTMLGVPKNGSVTVKVRQLLAENTSLANRQSALASAVRELDAAA